MLRVLSFVLLLLSEVPVCAQSDTLRNTEFHLGLGAQKFIHAGARYHVASGFFAEADLGVAPIMKSPVSYSLGVAYVTDLTSSTFYSLIYTASSTNIFAGNHSFIRLVTANIGIISQHEVGGSYQIRIGAGFGQDNLFVQRTKDPDYWEISYFPWFNLEISVGYAL